MFGRTIWSDNVQAKAILNMNNYLYCAGLSKQPMFGRTIWSDDVQARAILLEIFHYLWCAGLSKQPMFGRTIWSDDVQARAIMDIIQEFKLSSVKEGGNFIDQNLFSKITRTILPCTDKEIKG
jgi:hypothetical protein